MRFKLLNTLFLLFLFNLCYSQEISVKTGLSLSNIRINNSSSKFNVTKTPHIALGINYFNQRNWCISSELNYLNKGITINEIKKTEAENIIGDKINYKERWPILQINNTFRYKVPIKNNYLYCGIGPSIEIVLKNNVDNSIIVNKLNRSNIGVIAEIGYKIRIQKQLYIGVGYSYASPITSSATSLNDMKIKSSLSLFSISIDYKLN